MDENKKKELITSAISVLIGLIIGLLLGLFLFEKECPSCEIEKDPTQKAIDTSDPEVKGSTAKVEIDQQPIESESNVSLPVSECSLHVDIAGAINKPGVYCLKEGDKIVDVVKKAKGFTKDVAYKYVSMKINLSELITNHQKIYIPFDEDVYCEVKNLQYIDKEETTTQQEQDNNNTSDSTQTCININTASKAQLTSLNGVGESTAQKIIDSRRFDKVEDILNVSGIGDSTYEKFKDDICVY